MRGHDGLLLDLQGILLAPEAGDGLPLGVEAEAGLAVEGVGAAAGDAGLVAAEAEHGQRHGDGHVDAQLAHVEVALELRRRAAGAREHRRPVAVPVRVDERDGRRDALDVDGDQHRAEDLFPVALHVRFHVGDYCGGDLAVGGGG